MASPPIKTGDWVLCAIPDRERLVHGRAYQVLELWEDDLGCPLYGLNLWPGVLFGAWRFVADDTNQK